MANAKRFLILRLEGALQAWGENGKWDFRDSSSMPTKSGIVGLLGCAMGEERGSEKLTALAQNITVAVRADRPGVKFVDFQTIKTDRLMTANGTPRGKNASTIVSPREYLQDACFTVFLETETHWREEIEEALRNPKWCMYLGRKNCVPGRPILADVVEYADWKEALASYPAADRAVNHMPYECEIPESGMATILRPDDLVGGDRQFALRRVWRGTVRKERNDVSD